MAYEEQPHRSVRQDGIPAQRAASWIENPPDADRGQWLTPRRVMRLLTIILLGAVAGVVVARVLPATHTARAEILYNIEAVQQGDPLKQDRQLTTQVVLLNGRAVLGPIAKKQGRQVEDIQKDVGASVIGNSNVIQVGASGATQQDAMQTLQAVVDGYLALAGQPSGVARNLSDQLVQARQNTAQLTARVAQLRTAVLAGTANQTALDDVRAQLTASQDWETALQARISEVTLTGQAASPAQVLTPPYPLPDPTVPRWLVAAGIGALAGLVVAGLILATGLARAQRRALRATGTSRPDPGLAPVRRRVEG